MRFSIPTTASILVSLLAFEAVGAPAPQYDTTEIIMTTVIAAAGSATDSVSVSASASVSTSAGTSAKSCKAHSGRAQAWRQHRRPRPSASAPPPGTGNTAAPAPSQELPSSGAGTPAESTSTEPVSSASQEEAIPSPVETPMASSTETAPVVTAPPIQAGGDGEVVQNPPSSQVAQPSVVDASSSEVSSFTESSSSSTSSSSAQPSASAQGGGSDAPAGFGAEILQAHNSFRATWGAGPLVWNQSIADKGNEYYKSRNCDVAHSTLGFGENLGGGGGDFATAINGSMVLNMWADEAKDWPVGATAPPSDDPAKKDIVTGHFTQVVWKATTSLGCGVFTCDGNMWLAFCEYMPSGNMGGEYGLHGPDMNIPGEVGSPQ